MDDTRIPSINFPIAGDGNSPVKIKYTAAPKDARPMRSAMSYPRTATRLGSMRVTAVFQTAFLSASLMRLFPFMPLRISTTAPGGPARAHRLPFTRARPGSSLDDRSGMAETRAFARRFAADVGDHRFGD